MKVVCTLLILFFCAACSDDSTEEVLSTSNYDVDILFSPAGLGDSGYNDIILYGIQQSCKKHGFNLIMHRPKTVEKGWELYEEWKENHSNPHRQLFIFASNHYEPLLRQSEKDYDDQKSVLLFESDGGIEHVATFRLEMYGAAYYIGRLVAHTTSTAALLLANPQDQNIKRCADGFKEGYLEENKDLDFGLFYLADKLNEGYDIPDSAYRKAYTLYESYAFVFPLAGGSNQGVLQYTREYPHGIYTAGVDGNMSAYSTQVLASLIKRLDWAVEDYVDRWIAGEKIEGYTVYGLESGWTDVIVADSYKEFYDPIMAGLTEKAIEKEREYVEQN